MVQRRASYQGRLPGESRVWTAATTCICLVLSYASFRLKDSLFSPILSHSLSLSHFYVTALTLSSLNPTQISSINYLQFKNSAQSFRECVFVETRCFHEVLGLKFTIKKTKPILLVKFFLRYVFKHR